MPDGDIRFEEYKLVQDKIDKIGNFRFVIRGWAVTLVSTFIGAAALADLQPLNNLVLLLAILLFASVEATQIGTSAALSARAFELERAMSGSSKSGGPALAGTIATSYAKLRQRRSFWMALADLTNRHFYAALAILVVVSTVLRLLSPHPPRPITITTSGPVVRISAEPVPLPVQPRQRGMRQ